MTLTFGGDLPAARMVLTLEVPTGEDETMTTTTQHQEWAARRDFRARDQVAITDTTNFTVEDSRFIVRAEGPAWAEGDTFVDDGGQRRTVRRVNEIGRGRWLELLGRSID